MKAKQKSALPMGTPRISKLGLPDCFISKSKELKPLQLNTLHLEMLMWRPKGGHSSRINVTGLYTKMTLERQVHCHPDTRAWNNRGQQLSLEIAAMRTFSIRGKK